jgi:DNA-binding response OmpR family regulator
MTAEKSPRGTILIIEDEPLIRWSLAQALGDAGYDIREAATGVEGMAAIETLESTGGRSAAVLLDLRLPDVADLSLTRRIRAARPDVPVIMMSAYATSDDVAQALAAGVSCFVGKPFDVRELVALVERVLASHPPRP